MTVDREGLQQIAAECVRLVADEFHRTLDWQVDSLAELDAVCEELRNGGLAGERFDLWWKLIGAYVGEVVIRTYEGEWITHEMATGAYAVNVNGTTGFPFTLVQRVLEGEPFKSLDSFGRMFPHVQRVASES